MSKPLDTKWIDELLDRSDADELHWAQTILNQWMDEMPDDEYEKFMDGVVEGVVSEQHMRMFLEFAEEKRDDRDFWDRISEHV